MADARGNGADQHLMRARLVDLNVLDDEGLLRFA